MLTADFLNGVSVPFVLSNDALLGRGATAQVHSALVGDRRFAVKLYNQEHELNEAKILGMCAFGDPSKSDDFEFAWPVAVVKADTTLTGYLMETFDKSIHYPLNYLFDPTFFNRLNSINIMSLSNRVDIALSLCRAVSALHSREIYFIDLKPQNILVNWRKNTCVLLDCDGFSFKGPDGARFPAGHISTDYIAPEATRAKLAATDLSASQDNYALAVILFQIFNYAQHPFQGISNGTGLKLATNDEYAAAGLYPYGIASNRLIAPRQGSTHECMPNELRILFDRTFTGHSDRRVSPQEWVAFFENVNAERLLKRCDQRPSEPTHISFQGGRCAECARLAFANQQTQLRPIVPPTPSPVIRVPPQVSPPVPPQVPPKSNTLRNVVLYGMLVIFVWYLLVGNDDREAREAISAPSSTVLKPTSKTSTPVVRPENALGLKDHEILNDAIVSTKYLPSNCKAGFCRLVIQLSSEISLKSVSDARLYAVDSCNPTKAEIQNAQEILRSLAYDVFPDGVMGPRTKKAFRNFQAKNNLPITESLDTKTALKLKVWVGAYNAPLENFKFHRVSIHYDTSQGPVLEFHNIDPQICFYVGAR